MEFKEIESLAVEVANLYSILNKKDHNFEWKYNQYLQSLIGDLGILNKLILVKEKYLQIDGIDDNNIDEKIEHQLADCLWSLILISNKLNVNLEVGFVKNMNQLKDKLAKKL